jgi:SAM-dependent methyltransferase
MSGRYRQAGRRVVTGAEYAAQICVARSDREARTAFQQLATSLLAPGAAVFDFGAGPGIDARYYAEQGHTVAAYDVDPAMCEAFATSCGDLMAAGRVRLESGGYREFLVRRDSAAGTFALVTSNFAPLSLIIELPELFAKFHALTAPGGRVLASVLNPYFIGDARYGWWWRNGPRLLRHGQYCVQGQCGPIIRRRLAELATRCAPHFTLQRVFVGRRPRTGSPIGVDVSGGIRCAWLHLISCRFMFLLFTRCERLPAPRLPDTLRLDRAASGTHLGVQ